MIIGVHVAFCFFLDHIGFHSIRGLICSKFDVLNDLDCSGIVNKCIKEAREVTLVFHYLVPTNTSDILNDGSFYSFSENIPTKNIPDYHESYQLYLDMIRAKVSHDYDFNGSTFISEINVVDEANINIAAEINNNENESDDHDIGTFVKRKSLDCFFKISIFFAEETDRNPWSYALLKRAWIISAIGIRWVVQSAFDHPVQALACHYALCAIVFALLFLCSQKFRNNFRTIIYNSEKRARLFKKIMDPGSVCLFCREKHDLHDYVITQCGHVYGEKCLRPLLIVSLLLNY